MLLPQSSAFAALKNRLNSVSAIGYLQTGPRPYVPYLTAPLTIPWQGSVAEAISSYQSHHPRSKSVHDTYSSCVLSPATTPSASNYDRPNRLGKGREDNTIRWDQLLEKFRSVQEKARRAQRMQDGSNLDDGLDFGGLRITEREPPRPLPAPSVPPKDSTPPAAPPPKRSGLGKQFGRLGASVSGRGKRSQPQ